MHFCNCFPKNVGLKPDRIVQEVAEGANEMRDVVAKTDAGNGCHTCRPRLVKANPVIKELAAERNATGPGWPTDDQLTKAVDKLNKVALSS